MLGRWVWGLLLWAWMPSVGLAQPRGEGPTLVFGGDVLYDAPLAYQLRHRARRIGRDAAYREVFSDLSDSLTSADLAVVNLEVPISARYRERSPNEDVPVFRAPPHFLDALRNAGVDAFTIANNHAYDQGLRGLRSTMGEARARSIPLVGVGEDRDAAATAEVFEVAGARVAMAAWTEGTNHRPRGAEGTSPRIAFLRDGTVASSLAAARGRAQLVVAIFHWVHEDLTRPRPMMREAARQAAEAGADLVIGHGTHVPGSTEVIETRDGRRVHVLYSLGNLLAAMEEPAGTLSAREVGVRDAPLAVVRTGWRNERLEVTAIEVRHHWIARPLGAAPWLEGGSLAIARPVWIARELERLDRSRCGARCDRRAAMYRRRVALVDQAMANLDSDLLAPARRSTPPPIASTTRRPSPNASPRAPTPSAVEPPPGNQPTRSREPSPDALAVRAAPRPRSAQRPTERPLRGRARRTSTRGRTPRIVIADSDPRLQPYLRGVRFPIEFVDGAVAERTVDAAALARVVAIMQEDHGLQCEIVGSSTEAEAAARPSLGAMRARRLKVLIAGRGPSRSRFRTRGGRPGRPQVILRLRRR